MPHTASRVLGENEVSLGERIYKVTGPPQRRMVSVFPGKVVIGDFQQESNPIASVRTWDSSIFGIGRENSTLNDPRARQQAWFSDMSLRHERHLVLQRRSVATATNSGIGSDEKVLWLAELGSQVYAIPALKIFLYDNSGDSWGSNLNTFATTVTDVITAPVNGTETVVVAQSGQGVDYTTDGSTWTDEAGGTDIKLLAWGFRDLLWGISSTGDTYFTANLADGWTKVATLKAIKGAPTRLFLGPNPANPVEDVLYCATQKTLYVYDNQNERWYQTKLGDLPFHTNGGSACTTWRGFIYYNAGLAIYQIDPTGQVPVQEIGPTQDNGLPAAYQGTISAMAGTHQDLLIAVDGSAAVATAEETDDPLATAGIHPANILGGGSGRSTILGWKALTQAWEVKWRDSVAGGKTTRNILISNSYSAYRAYWGSGQTMYYQGLPVGIENPNQVQNAQREPTGFWWGPHFSGDVATQNKLAMELKVEVSGADSSNTVTPSYVINGDDNDSAIKSFTAITTDGEHTFPLPNVAEPEGIPFLTFQPRITVARGSVLTDTPDVKSVSLVFLKTLETQWGWEFVILMDKSVRRYSAEEMRDALVGVGGAVEEDKLLPFTIKDEADGEQNYWVKIFSVVGEEATGHKDKSAWRVFVAEPV